MIELKYEVIGGKYGRLYFGSASRASNRLSGVRPYRRLPSHTSSGIEEVLVSANRNRRMKMVATSDVEKAAFFAVLRSYGIEEVLMTSFRFDDIKSCSRYDDHHHTLLMTKKKLFRC